MNLVLIHRRILRALEAAAPYALPEVTLLDTVNCDLRPALDLAALQTRLSWLTDCALIRVLPEELDPDARKWVLTEAGKATLATLPK
jgi:hypothetical protein